MQLTASDQCDLAGLPELIRRDVESWLKMLHPVWRAHEAKAPIVAVLDRAARESGKALPTFTRKWYALKKDGWKGLINRARYQLDRNAGLPAEFITFWKTLLEAHQRDTGGREAHRKLIRQWRSWRSGVPADAMPGYDAAPEPEAATGMPRGWTLVNLRKHGLTRYERALRRRGTMAAKNFLPSVRTTRVGIEFFSHLMFDDQWHDVHVNFIGRDGVAINRKAMRPLSFNALDVASACDFTRAYKPIIWNHADQKRQMLTEADFFWFLVHVLTEFGWRGDIGTVFIHEHGTANVNGIIRQRITEATDGKVTFSAGGIMGAPLRKGLFFEGQPRGNFKFKAHRESWFNLFRNYCAHLIAPTGRNRDMAPEENYGLLKYNNMMIRAMDHLPPERAAMLALPVLNWHQYVPLADAIAELINRRVDHNLEGWELLGHIAQEVRLDLTSDKFLGVREIAALQDGHAQQLALALMSKEGYGRTRNLSPREVFDAARDEAPLTRLNPHLWNLIIPAEYAHEARVTAQHEIIVRDRTVSPEPMIFQSLVRTERGREQIIPPGEAVRVYMNPFRPQQALICELNDARIGLAQRMAVPCRTDLDGMTRVNGGVKHLESHLQRQAAQRARAVMDERSTAREHNTAIIAGENVTVEEMEAAEAADAGMEIISAPAPYESSAPDDEAFDPLES